MLWVAGVLVLGSGCRRAEAPRPRVIYLNRREALSPGEQRALAAARGEVERWDAGARILDYRIQGHSAGWTVSFLLHLGLGDDGRPVLGEEPVRNVEIGYDGAVRGYHLSR